MKRKMLFIFIILCMHCSFNAWAQSGSEEQSRKIDGYKLIWSDEFNKDGFPDTANWRFENGFVRNEELQVYS